VIYIDPHNREEQNMISRTHNDQGAGGKEHNGRKDFPKYRRAVIDIHVRIGIFRRDGYCCKHCGEQFSRNQLELDHIKPISTGGDDSIENLQTLCRTCNRKKGNRFAQ